MHALDRFHLPRTTAVSLVAAILAIVITLVLAAGVAGVSGTGGGAGQFATPARSVTSVSGQLVPRVWGRGPFVPLTDSSLSLPWASTRP